MPKTKQLCEISSIFQVGKIKNEAILRDFLQKWNVECRADGLVPMRFAIFPVHLSKVLRLPRKSDARSYEVLHLSRKIIFRKLTIWCSKMQPLSGNLRPDLLTHLPHVSLVLRLPREMHLSRSSSNVPRLPSFLKLLQNPHILLTFDKVHNPVPERGVFCTFWLGNVLLTTTACHFFNISTSKSALKPSVFNTFDFEMCFAPQRRALFRHPAPGVFCYILTWKCASRHNDVQSFISHLARWLRTLHFSEPTFRLTGATNHWINIVFRDFPTFSHAWIFFLLRLSLCWSSFFFSSLLWLFPSLLFICPYCRKFDF